MNSQEVVDFIKERLNNNVDLKVICEEVCINFTEIES